MSRSDEFKALGAKIKKGGAPKYHEANAAVGKKFCRDRIALLCDDGGREFVEDGLFANATAGDLPADGVVTGIGRVHGRPVAIMANDSTVKAGSWGARTVEKIVRIQETAMRLRIPLFYLVDSAGARITDQIDMFPGRRHAGRIFRNQVRMSGAVPQICLLFGPSAAGGAYIPAFCDVVFMVEKNASMYLGSPRMAEMVIGEKVTLEEMGGARMHCEVSGCGDLLAKDEKSCIAAARFVGPCDASNIPLLFLADVPGFMIGKAVERQGIIRHGAKMISAMADATVPRICVVLRKAYGAGLYAMSGPGFEPDATIALPQAMIAVMGAEAAVNAVYANKIAEKPEAERAAFVEQLREEYRADIDLLKLASNLHVDAVVPGDELRAELVRRLAATTGKS